MLGVMIQRWGIASILFLYLFFPLTYSLAKQGFEHGPQILFVGLHMITSGFGLLLLCFFYEKRKFSIEKQHRKLFLSVLIFSIVFTFVPQFWAVKYMSVAKTSLTFVLTPFFSFLFSYLHRTETFSFKKLLGLMVGLLGLGSVLVPQLFLENSSSGNTFSWPEVMTLFSVICFAYGWIPIRKLVRTGLYSPLFINGFCMFFGGFVCCLCSYFIEPWGTGTSLVTHWPYFLWYVFIISFVGASCYVFYAALLRYYSATLVGFMSFSEPFFSSFMGWVFLNEEVAPVFFLSTTVVATGLYIFYQEELQMERELAKLERKEKRT